MDDSPFPSPDPTLSEALAACDRDDPAAFGLALERLAAQPDHRPERLFPLWKEAFDSGVPGMVERLIDFHAPLSPPPGSQAASPLHLAVSRNHLAACQALLAAGADPNASIGEPGSSAVAQQGCLQAAILGGASALVSLLLAHGASPNASPTDPDALPPLHLAAFVQNHAAIAALLAHGADPDAQINEGNTARHFLVAGSLSHPSSRDTPEIVRQSIQMLDAASEAKALADSLLPSGPSAACPKSPLSL